MLKTKSAAANALRKAATNGVLWQTTHDLVLSNSNRAEIKAALNEFRKGLYPHKQRGLVISNNHTTERLSPLEIIDTLGDEEKLKFLQIKKKFQESHRTIYVRLLYIILAKSKSKSQSQYNLNELFDNILKEDDIDKIYNLIDDALNTFISESYSKPPLGYSVHNGQIYSQPADALKGHPFNNVYTTPQHNLYETIHKNNVSQPRLPPKVSELIPRYPTINKPWALIFNKKTGHLYYRIISAPEYKTIYIASIDSQEGDKDDLVHISRDELTSIPFIKILNPRESIVGGRKTIKTRKTLKTRKTKKNRK